MLPPGCEGGILVLGVRRTLDLGNGRGLGRLGALDELVIEEHGVQMHIPFNVAGQHAQEDVGPHPGGRVVEDRPHMQIDRRQTLVGGDPCMDGSNPNRLVLPRRQWPILAPNRGKIGQSPFAPLSFALRCQCRS